MNIERTSPDNFEIVSEKQLKFPSICAKCGAETERTIQVKVSPTKPKVVKDYMLHLFGGHAWHIVHGIESLKSGSVKIPCCVNCHRPYYIGNAVALCFVVVGGTVFYKALNSNLPMWALFAIVPASMVLLLGWFIPFTIGKSKAAPVAVWLERDGYHYQFATNAYKKIKQQFKSANVQGQRLTPPPILK